MGHTYVINIDEYELTGIRLIALYANDDNLRYFDRFEVGYIPKEIKRIIGNKNITTNTYKIYQ